MQSKAATVAEYLSSLPPEQRAELEAVRAVFQKNLGKGYQEGIQYGMIGYCVPHSVYPAGYHCDPKQPLPFAAIAAQKNSISVHLMFVYCNAEHNNWFRKAWAKTGKKLDMGKACLRFKKAEDAALDVIGEAIRRVPVETYIENVEKALKAVAARPKKGPSKKTATPAKKKAAKPAPSKKAR